MSACRVNHDFQRLRVAHVSLGLDIGGQERLLVDFARHANRNRFELIFISLTGRGKLAEVIETLGCPVLALAEPEGLRPGLVFRLAQLFRRHNFGIVHTHDDRPLLYGSLAARLARIPRLLHTQHHGLLPKISPRQRRLGVWAGRLTDAFVCVSHDSACWMTELGFPPRRLTTLWNGIDLDKYGYRGPCSNGPAVAVARLSQEKDIATLLRAVALVVSRAPDFRLEIAGDGPLRVELQALAAQLGLKQNVSFLGAIADIPELLARARLFVLPSQTEGISLTILEAMASGLPVVATRVGGNPEVVVDGTTGLLVSSGAPAALADCLLRLWTSQDEGRRLGENGRRRVEAKFDVRKMVASYEALYLELGHKSGRLLRNTKRAFYADTRAMQCM